MLFRSMSLLSYPYKISITFSILGPWESEGNSMMKQHQTQPCSPRSMYALAATVRVPHIYFTSLLNSRKARNRECKECRFQEYPVQTFAFQHRSRTIFLVYCKVNTQLSRSLFFSHHIPFQLRSGHGNGNRSSLQKRCRQGSQAVNGPYQKCRGRGGLVLSYDVEFGI